MDIANGLAILSLVKRMGAAGGKVGRAAESSQEHGRDGVIDAKAWLESTTHIELNFNANRFRPVCTVQLLNDHQKTFDLFGKLFTTGAPLYVEAKNYETVGHQKDAFDEFLVTAYSATVHIIKRIEDWRAEFMWVTAHPFAQGNWPRLTSRAYLSEALAADRTGLLKDHEVDEDIVDLVAGRLWLMVVTERQRTELILSDGELARVHGVLLRKNGLA